MSPDDQVLTVSPLGFCLLELAESKMVRTLRGKTFLRLDEVAGSHLT